MWKGWCTEILIFILSLKKCLKLNSVVLLISLNVRVFLRRKPRLNIFNSLCKFLYIIIIFLVPSLLLTAPSPAENIQISVQMKSVHVSWSPGVGNVDQYRLILLDKGSQLQQNDLEKHVLSYNFSGLTPGHQYNLTIITRAAGLENYNFRLIRTGEPFTNYSLWQNCGRLCWHKLLYSSTVVHKTVRSMAFMGNRKSCSLELLEVSRNQITHFNSYVQGLPHSCM